MRYLGIDYGTKRTGVAISDPGGVVAVVKETIDSNDEKDVIVRLQEIVTREDVDAIVVGLPTSLDGKKSQMTHQVQAFVNRLAVALEVPVYTIDERFTSRTAEELTRKHKTAQTDQVAAQILLQNYLDSQ